MPGLLRPTLLRTRSAGPPNWMLGAMSTESDSRTGSGSSGSY